MRYPNDLGSCYIALATMSKEIQDLEKTVSNQKTVIDNMSLLSERIGNIERCMKRPKRKFRTK